MTETADVMPSPYGTEEIAAAILELAGRRGQVLAGLEVRADDAAARWTIRADLGGAERRRLFPYAMRSGMTSPAELAALFLGDDWQFG